MKCIQDGCFRDAAVRIVSIIETLPSDSQDSAGPFCRPCMANYLRVLADKVEGVVDCEECEGHGILVTLGGGMRCHYCHGTGKVPCDEEDHGM